MKIVVALDGELLTAQYVGLGIDGQRKSIVGMVNILGGLIEAGHQMVITHGNSQQVGIMLLRAEMASHAIYTLPLDLCGADTQGATGYLLQQAWRNWLDERNFEKEVSTIVTQVLVDESAPFEPKKLKGVGPFFDQERMQAYQSGRGWDFVMVPGRGYQRAVPAVVPRQIIEANTIRHLLELGHIVICAGGGGVPVKKNMQGRLEGVEAVVDKAHSAVLAAQAVQAETIVFVSAWERIERAFSLSITDGLACLSLAVLDELLERAETVDDTIRTKLVASRKFLQEGGKSVLLVSPEQLRAKPNLGWGVRLVADEVVSSPVGAW